MLVPKKVRHSKGIKRESVRMIIECVFGLEPSFDTTIVLVKYLAKVLEK